MQTQSLMEYRKSPCYPCETMMWVIQKLLIFLQNVSWTCCAIKNMGGLARAKVNCPGWAIWGAGTESLHGCTNHACKSRTATTEKTDSMWQLKLVFRFSCLHDKATTRIIPLILQLSHNQSPSYVLYGVGIFFIINGLSKEMHSSNRLTSFVKVMLKPVLLAHHVCVPSDANVDSIVLMHLPIVQLVVQLVGCGVERMAALLVLIAVVVVEDGGLTDGHADDGAAVLVGVAGAPVTVATLWPQQHRRDIVDLVGGLGAGALLGYAPTLAPSVAGVQHKGEEEDQEQEGDEASLDKSRRGKKYRDCKRKRWQLWCPLNTNSVNKDFTSNS